MSAKRPLHTKPAAGPSSVPAASTQPPGRTPRSIRLLRFVFRTAGPLAPRLMGRVAFDLWFRTTRARSRPEEAEVMARAHTALVPFGDTAVSTYAWGSGPTVLLLHGWNGRAAQMTAFVDPLLRTGYRVIAFDAPAHGRSPGRRTDVFEIIRAMEAVSAGHGPFHGVIAHSFGSLSSAIAITDGAIESSRIVCLAPAVTPDPLVAHFAAALDLPERVLPDFRRRLDRFAGPGFWARAQPVIPALVIHDRDDDWIPYSNSVGLIDRWPNAELHGTDGLGHFDILRDPPVVHRAVSFLAASAPREAPGVPHQPA